MVVDGLVTLLLLLVGFYVTALIMLTLFVAIMMLKTPYGYLFFGEYFSVWQVYFFRLNQFCFRYSKGKWRDK